MAAQYKYIVDIIGNSKQFVQEMQKATTSAGKLEAVTEDVDRGGIKLKGTLGALGSGLGKVALLVGGPLAALELLAGSLEAVEGPGDAFEEVVSGGKEALFEFQRALSTMNFSDFFKDMKEGYDRGKEFAQIMDKLKDDTAYADYINSMKRLESSELRETIKNKTLDISVRTKASNEREAIESEVLERTKAIAKKEYDALAENWAKKNTKNKVSAEEAIKLYEWVQALPKEHVDAMENQFNYNASKVGWEKNKGLDWQAVGVFDKNENERYKQYWMMMKEGEAEVLPKLFELSKKYNVTAKEAQDQYNAVVKENSMLLERERPASMRKL
jgi:hypothetical protein